MRLLTTILLLSLTITVDARVLTGLVVPPTYAVPIEDGWQAEFWAVLYKQDQEESDHSLIGKAIRGLYDIPDEGPERERFNRRWGPFRAEMEEDKRLFLLLENQTLMKLPKTDEYGQTRFTLKIPDQGHKQHEGWFYFNLLYGVKNTKGKLYLQSEQGISLISDIDDTIKVSEVTDTQALIQNTFSQPYRSVPGMAGLYRVLNNRGVSIHYVSASPWQLYEPLAGFLREAGFPDGTLDLFRYKSSGWKLTDIFKSGMSKKREPIERLLKAFPQRRFILVGDSGEQDAELYSDIAKVFPGQVLKIFIRDIQGTRCADADYQELLVYFCTPETIKALVDAIPMPTSPGKRMGSESMSTIRPPPKLSARVSPGSGR